MPYRYVIFHKPFNVLCQFSRGTTPPASGDRKTLADFLTIPGVYPVGRLDFDSEGLLLLTNDGLLQHRLSHPSFEHAREYWVQVEGRMTDEALERLRVGVLIEEILTKPCDAAVLPEPSVLDRVPPIRMRLHIPTSWISIVLTEGRNRQVRRMTAAVGFPTLRLIRVALGPLKLACLAPGQHRPVTRQELLGLKQKRTAPKNRL